MEMFVEPDHNITLQSTVSCPISKDRARKSIPFSLCVVDHSLLLKCLGTPYTFRVHPKTEF